MCRKKLYKTRVRKEKLRISAARLVLTKSEQIKFQEKRKRKISNPQSFADGSHSNTKMAATIELVRL